MNWLSLSDWINLLLSSFQALQQGLLYLLAASGLAQVSHGQPAWPFAQRLAGEIMLIDRSVARDLLSALGFSAAALLTLILAMRWRRGRAVTLLATLALLWFSPWPEHHLLLAAAAPTSFATSPTGFSATAIVHGQRVYQQHCADCHGADGKGDTPLALSLPMAPPNLASQLLWKRADGDLFWRIAYGMHDRHGAATMPGFTHQLSDRDIWSLIDFMKANAAGTSIRDSGAWQEPVALPALAALPPGCGQGTAAANLQWQGQRVRVILAAPQAPQHLPGDDPRLHSVVLSAAGLSLPAAQPGVPAIDCVVRSADAWQALAIITGLPATQLAGTQLLTDRDGWLRARKLTNPGNNDGNGSDWSADDIVCHGNDTPVTGKAGSTGLDGLIAAMDAEPVRFVQGGFVHTTQSVEETQ